MTPALVHELIAAAAARAAASPALVDGDRTLPYGELWGRVGGVAAGLSRIGLERRDRVAIYLDKRAETVASIFGTAAAGGAFVPVNPLLRPGQVGHILDDCGARFLVTSADRLEPLAERISACEGLEHVVLVDGSQGSQEGLAGDLTLTPWEELQGGEPVAPAPNIDAEVAAILYTSGSTGSPKGVVLSHRNLVAGAESVSGYLGNHEGDRLLAALPLSFDAGLSQLTTGFAAGAQVVLHNYLLPGDLVRACAEHGITGLTCVPPLWVQLAEQEWPSAAAASMRYFANTGGRLPRATLERLRALFPDADPYLMYGLTEAFRSTYLDPAEIDRRPDSIGKAIPNAEVLVVREDGSLCEPGEEGELVHRGALVAMGYWNDAERTAQRFRPAPGGQDAVPTEELAVWSGDRVKADEEGFLYFVGRDDEMIKTSGYRVSPTEVEEAAYGTGLVRDALALGLDDARIGQRIVLAVSPPDGAEVDAGALLEGMRRELPTYMLPKHVEVRESLPRSPNGKLDRQLVRTELSGS